MTLSLCCHPKRPIQTFGRIGLVSSHRNRPSGGKTYRLTLKTYKRPRRSTQNLFATSSDDYLSGFYDFMSIFHPKSPIHTFGRIGQVSSHRNRPSGGKTSTLTLKTYKRPRRSIRGSKGKPPVKHFQPLENLWDSLCAPSAPNCFDSQIQCIYVACIHYVYTMYTWQSNDVYTPYTICIHNTGMVYT